MMQDEAASESEMRPEEKKASGDQEESSPVQKSGSITASQQQQLEQTLLPVHKWSTEKVLEWLNKKMQHHLPAQNSEQNAATIARLSKIFASKKITGDVLLELNNDYLEYMSITEYRLKDIILEEVALLRIRNEYEFIRRFKSQAAEAENN